MTDRDVPHFLLEDDAETRRYRWRESVFLSVITHLIGIILLLVQPMIARPVREMLGMREEPPKSERNLTYLAMPPDTRPAPAAPRTPFLSDKNRVAQPGADRPRLEAPKMRPAPPAEKSERPLVAQAQPPPLPNAPQIQQAQPPPVLPESRQPQLGQPSAPPVRPGDLRLEQPKLPAPAPGVPGGAPTSTGRALEEAMRGAARDRGGQVIGDEPLPPGAQPRSQASVGEARILTDTQGVDFDPYLRRVVADIRQNWYAVMPEIARLGRRGRVIVVFEIQRDGGVSKLYLVSASGAEPLDRAALAGISASVPFPPLPPEFRGPMIRLQVTFLYNMAFSVQ